MSDELAPIETVSDEQLEEVAGGFADSTITMTDSCKALLQATVNVA
jgi:hypothetical protein